LGSVKTINGRQQIEWELKNVLHRDYQITITKDYDPDDTKGIYDGLHERDRKALILGAQSNRKLQERIDYLNKHPEMNRELKSNFITGLVCKKMKKQPILILWGLPDKVEKTIVGERWFYTNCIVELESDLIKDFYQLRKGKLRKIILNGIGRAPDPIKDYYPENLKKDGSMKPKYPNLQYNAEVLYYTWSPDGSKIAFLRRTSITLMDRLRYGDESGIGVNEIIKLYIMDMKNKKIIKVIPVYEWKRGMRYGGGPWRISWGGKYILFDLCSDIDNSYEITLYTIDTENPYKKIKFFSFNTTTKLRAYALDKAGDTLVLYIR